VPQIQPVGQEDSESTLSESLVSDVHAGTESGKLAGVAGVDFAFQVLAGSIALYFDCAEGTPVFLRMASADPFHTATTHR